MPETTVAPPVSPVTSTARAQLATALPLPAEPQFGDFLVALDSGFVHPQAEAAPVHRGRPWRVLALAVLAVLIVLTFATAAAAAAWELADHRYVDEIVRENV